MPYKGVETFKGVLKTLKENSKRKAQKGQYVLAVDLGYYIIIATTPRTNIPIVAIVFDIAILRITVTNIISIKAISSKRVPAEFAYKISDVVPGRTHIERM